MADIYRERPEELARFYAERMGEGFGPALPRKLGFAIRDARQDGDRARCRFWERVREIAQEGGG